MSETIEVRKLAQLTPNSTNATVFGPSLEHVAGLQADIVERGQLVPLRVFPDGTIISGERRWRAMRAAGFEDCEVIVVQSAHADVAVFLDATSQRDIRPSERVRLLTLGERLGDELGRVGPPEGVERREWLAQLVGFSSARTARKARRVFNSGFEDIQRELDSGYLSIDAADREVTLRKRTEEAEEDDTARNGDDDDELGDEDVADEVDEDAEVDEGEEEDSSEGLTQDLLNETFADLDVFDIHALREAVRNLVWEPLDSFLHEQPDPDADQLRVAVAIEGLASATTFLTQVIGGLRELGWDVEPFQPALQHVGGAMLRLVGLFAAGECSCGGSSRDCSECCGLGVVGHAFKHATRGVQ